jgi:hypothetical protein
MAADGSDAASFTVRLVNQVTAPARQVQQAMSGVTKSMQAAQKRDGSALRPSVVPCPIGTRWPGPPSEAKHGDSQHARQSQIADRESSRSKQR